MFTGREFGQKSNSIYYAYITKHHIKDSEESRTLFNAAFYLGAAYSLQVSTELSPHVARFIEFVMWIAGVEDEKTDSNLQHVRGTDFPSPPY